MYLVYHMVTPLTKNAFLNRCTANPDYSLIHEQTFHDSTRGSSTDPELYFDYFFTGLFPLVPIIPY